MNEASSKIQIGRILAIDYGERRVGISISDPMTLIACGLTTLQNDSSLVNHLCSLIKEYDIRKIIVGMPYTLKGEIGKKGQEVMEFVSKLKQEVDVPVTMWDERFTSKMAQQAIREMGIGRMARRKKERVDQMASTLLLQSYLDSLKP